MQFKRIKNLIEKNNGVIVNVGIKRDKYNNKDYFNYIVFSYHNELYKIYYDRDKMKGYEYSIGIGNNLNEITIMSSRINYQHVKTFLNALFN